MKKIVSILLASAVSATLMSPAYAKDTFSDVNGNYSWAYDYVEDMAARGLISGYEDGTYRPGKSVSRLEAFALFARLMGSNSDVNKDVLELAKEKYADILEDYDLTYAEGDVAYMLLKGVITEEELDTYLSSSKKNGAMPRYEAAILITKALAAEKRAKAEVLLDMDYTDVYDIPNEAKPYVYYASEAGIISGMGDGTFSPNTEVNRGQIAVMLSRTLNKVNYSFEDVKILGVDTDNKNIEIEDFEGESHVIGYSDGTIFKKGGDSTEASKLVLGSRAVLTYREEDGKVILAYVDAFAPETDETIKVIFNSYSNSAGNMRVATTNPVNMNQKTYACAPNAVITLDGIPVGLNKLTDGDYITIGLVADTIVSIEAMQINEDITNATIVDLDLFGTMTISHKNDAYNGMTLPISNEAKIYKNGDTIEINRLYPGDNVTLELEYGIITKITASSVQTTIKGALKSYTISATPSVTIKAGGEDLTYQIPADVLIVVNGTKGGKLTDIEIGANVKLTVDSEIVTRLEAIDAVGTTASSSIKGIVTAVNPTAKVIIVKHEEGGSESTTYINCTDSTRILVLPSLSESSLKYIKENDVVEAYGTYSNGIFVCTGVTYSPSIK